MESCHLNHEFALVNSRIKKIERIPSLVIRDSWCPPDPYEQPHVGPQPDFGSRLSESGVAEMVVLE